MQCISRIPTICINMSISPRPFIPTKTKILLSNSVSLLSRYFSQNLVNIDSVVGHSKKICEKVSLPGTLKLSLVHQKHLSSISVSGIFRYRLPVLAATGEALLYSWNVKVMILVLQKE